MWLCAGGGASAWIPGDPHLQHSPLRVRHRGFTRLGMAGPYQRSGIDSSAGGFKSDSLLQAFHGPRETLRLAAGPLVLWNPRVLSHGCTLALPGEDAYPRVLNKSGWGLTALPGGM